MKFAVFLIIISALQAQAFSANSQSISVNARQTEIRKVLKDIERQSDFRFLYNYELKDLKKKVDVKADESSLPGVLDKVFAGSDLTYKMLNNNLVVVLSTNADENQAVRVTGTVTGASN
jgi:hypothetical protein